MNILDFQIRKKQQKKITMLTCYDYPSAKTIADTNIDCVLVGDSVAMVVHGHPNTLMANLEMMLLHTQAVARGIGPQLVVSDLPFLCHRVSQSDTMRSVRALMQAGAHAIKIEGADPKACEQIHEIVTAGVPVMGHIGLTPQFIHQLGGFKVQGKQAEQADFVLQQAQRLESVGCFALVIECVPAALATQVTKALKIPVIGIGAGPKTDGQVLVWHDLLGLQNELQPKFVKQFLQGKTLFHEAINRYVAEIQQQHFPSLTHSF